MVNNTGSAYKIVVAGDVTIDWNLIRQHHRVDGGKDWQIETSTRACWGRGGASLLADLISNIAKNLQRQKSFEYQVCQPNVPSTPVLPGDSRFHHSYVIWSTYISGDSSAWRIKEYLGLDCCLDEEVNDIALNLVPMDPPTADLLVLDDANLGFRHHPEYWPSSLNAEFGEGWIVLKMSRPVAQGSMWRHMLENHTDRLMVVTTVDDLRRSEIQISRGLSWERTAQDVVWELVHNPRVNGLARCGCVVVTFGAAGAVVLSKLQDQFTTDVDGISSGYYLLFDPEAIEGTWEQIHKGGMVGNTTCMVASLAYQLMQGTEQPDVLGGVQSGLNAIRELISGGYSNLGTAGKPNIAFPIERIMATIIKEESKFAVAEIEDPVRYLDIESYEGGDVPRDGMWTILEDRYQDNLEYVSERIVLEGVENVLGDVPLGIFGYLLTVDRQEIESLRSVRALIYEYLSQARQKRPFSIAVFGSPGSGKSFGITQVANSITPGEIEVLEFNLSQFESGDKLVDAFHLVRDVNLSGKTPLVFWDEFDTPLTGRTLGWLRYFLAPMQDGAFREGQLTHPIGRSIFVFAGGTSERMDDFGQGLDADTYRSAKVPDFVSRLKGYVNVLGPNRQEDPHEEDGFFDPYYIIRRGILMRSILQRNAPHLFTQIERAQTLNIDRGVLRAFLNIRSYKHGIRSMEAVVAMSELSGKNAYERSSLPPESQLDLHVDGQEFLALVQQMELTGELLYKLAEAAHNLYCLELERKGYICGEVTDDEAKTHSSLRPYSELPEYEKEQNLDNVRHIATKLAHSGYIMIPARSNEPAFEFPGSQMEKLAEMEHERWMALKLNEGWKYAPQTDKEHKWHADLLPWEDLSGEQKHKDRIMVQAIPKVLREAGYTIVRLRGEIEE
jgi:hypothetical protein